MIRINLLPVKRSRRPANTGQKHLAIGVAAVVFVAVGMYAFSYRTAKASLLDLRENRDKLQSDNAAKRAKLTDFDKVEAAVQEIKKRHEAISTLVGARSAPAHFMHELSEILKPGGKITMKAETIKKVNDGDPNVAFSLDWEPKHVWIEAFEEKAGVFTIEGFAQSKPDVTQFEKRLQASLFFANVERTGDERVSDTKTGISYYKFKITGKVVY